MKDRNGHFRMNLFLRLGFIIVSFTSLAHADGKHLVTIDDLSSLKRVDWQMDQSPDGGTLAYAVDGQLRLMDIAKGRSHVIAQGTMPRWSPTGTRLAFYSKRNGGLQLYLLALHSGEVTRITDVEGGVDPDPELRFSGWIGDPFSYSWSPDGTRIVFSSRLRTMDERGSRVVASVGNKNSGSQSSSDLHSTVTPLILTETSPPRLALTGLFRSSTVPAHFDRAAKTTNQLFVVDIRSKQVKQLTSGDSDCFNPDWSPDGAHIVFAAITDRVREDSDIYNLDIQTGIKAPLTKGPNHKRLPTWSPDGKWIAYLTGEKFGIDSLEVIPGTARDYMGEPVPLDRNIFAYSWAPDAKSVFLSYQDGASIPIARVSVPDAKVTRLTDLEAFCNPFSISRSGGLVWVQSTSTIPSAVYAADSDGLHQHLLVDVNPQAVQWALGKQEVIRWKNDKGDEIEGILIKPVNYHPGKLYPLIVDLYPGQVNLFYGDVMLANQALASKGYAVFFPNERTPATWENPVKGKSYNEAARGPHGIEVMMDDLMTGIDAVVSQGVVDPNRMCLYGFSNGGAAVTLALTRTSRFKCAVSTSGVALDWAFSFFVSGDSFFPDLLGGRTPWEDPDAYINLSPVFHVNRITTPVLLVVGDEEESEVVMVSELYNGLRYLRRDVTLMRYPVEGHGFSDGSLKDYWRRVDAFFDAHIGTD
jgi:dipeptidyl aminopeptidase/acylaminoacyl peptidase